MATTKITSPDLFNLESLNTALKLPSGTTAERPTSPSTGEWRYNTTTNLVEFWDGGAWRDLQSEDIPPIPSENFNTVLYTGTGSAQSITGVGFKPDMVWIKDRIQAYSHNITDSTRGTSKQIFPNSTNAQDTTYTNRVTSFDADGFTIGNDNYVNTNGNTFVAWCWKANGGTTSSNTDGTITSTVQANTKAAFSVVSYTGNAVSGATIGHGLGVEPDLVIVKNLNLSTQSWNTYVKNVTTTNAQFLTLNTSAANGNTANPRFIPGNFSSSVFSVGNDNSTNGASGVDTYIAYCFASVAGYSSIGTYTGNGSTNGPIVNTGFEPAMIIIKRTDSVEDWKIIDNKRGFANTLEPNEDGAEETGNNSNFTVLSTGFQIGDTNGDFNANGGTYLYIAFGSDASAAPALPDSFANKLWTGNGSARDINVGFSTSWTWIKSRSFARNNYLYDIIRGPNNQILSNSSGAEITLTGRLTAFNTDGFSLGTDSEVNNNGETYVAWNWKASPVPTINTDGDTQTIVSANQAAGFSIVRYTGTGSSGTYGHGLSSSPDWIITKRTDVTEGWIVWSCSLSASNYMYLNSSGAAGTDTNAYKTIGATTNQIGTDVTVNASGGTYIAYCFTSISGFSDFGSYTGNGSAGYAITGLGFQPSFIMIKGITSADNWFIFDSARGGSVTLNPNLPAAEYADTGVTSFDSDGFTLGSNAGGNRNGDTYIYMAYKENPTPMPLAGNMSFLVVAGGASGGRQNAGGAGAGGLRTSYGGSSGGGSSAESDITLAAGTYTITVGAGGAALTTNGVGNNGVDSSIAASGLTTITSVGGGGGYGFTYSSNNANSGGSGGGAGTTGSNSASGFGSGTANQGFDGGARNATANTYAGGGGGGASAAGQASTSQEDGGDGGAGLAVSITGASVSYAGGGGGGDNTSAGSGGAGGGTAGGVASGVVSDATANTGGGSGGTRNNVTAGSGGSGVVILRLLTSEYSSSTTGSPTVTTDGDYTVLTYTGSGTYVHS